jgi:hypothetical protein
MRETTAELVEEIAGAIGTVEPRLSAAAIRSAIEATTQSSQELRMLARALRHDITILTGPAGRDCIANIEPLVTNVQQQGGTAVRLPICAHCKRNVAQRYSRQLRKRICQDCATTRWKGEKSECANCGRVRRFAYRGRRGELLCGECKPEPEVDHGQKAREGIDALHTGLPASEIDTIVATFRAAVALRELNWILHDNPTVFTGDSPHRSARSVRLAELLIAAGADNIRVPQCPLCFREAPLRSALDDLRCCHRCWSHRRSRGQCARCGNERHLTNFHGTGERICTTCFERDPVNHHQCTKCGRLGIITRRDADEMLCRRCYRAPTATCSSCGRICQCNRIKTGKPICDTCLGKQRTKEVCSCCRRLRLVHIRTETGDPICSVCGRKREPCSRCGKTLQVAARLEGLGPLCSACLEREPAYFSDCAQCGAHGRMYHRGLCTDCACPGVLRRLFSRDDQLSGAAAQIVDALLKCDSSAVLHWAERTRLRTQLAAGIRDFGDTLGHDALDSLPPSKSVEWLRNVLVDAGALPRRDVYLHRTEKFVEARLLTIENRDDRVAARSFTKPKFPLLGRV